MIQSVIDCTFSFYARVFVEFIDASHDLYRLTVYSMQYVISIIGLVVVVFF